MIARTDPRLIGALLAVGLDAGLLVIAVVLVSAAITPAFGLVFATGAGLIVAPLLGWRYGPRATTQATDRWRNDALRSLALVDVLVVVAWVGLAFTVPVEGGVLGRLAFVGYTAAIDGLLVGLMTCLVAIPIGLAWGRLMYRMLG